jgi:hypothetical protein
MHKTVPWIFTMDNGIDRGFPFQFEFVFHQLRLLKFSNQKDEKETPTFDKCQSGQN